jgi:mono/diheme cytochrome c family protein
VLFERSCAACHGAGQGDNGSPMLPGTAALERKYRGQVPGALELREGLSAEIITVFVRQGIGSMPPFRRSELSDALVEAIAAYLEASARVNRPPGEEAWPS